MNQRTAKLLRRHTISVFGFDRFAANYRPAKKLWIRTPRNRRGEMRKELTQRILDRK